MKTINTSKKRYWMALATALTLAGAALPTYAGEGHDHGAAPATANANGPQRMADGSVFLPKPAQRQLNVRTMVVETAELPRAFELNGQVLMDPNAGGKVQPINAGRIEPGPNGLPSAGQTVKKGQVLAYVVPAFAPLERASQLTQLAEFRAAKALAEKRLARLRELSDTVPRKEVEAAESEVLSLTDRMSAVGGGLSSKEALVAPVSGVIASAHVVAGQVVDTRELIFEIVDPRRLRIEALAFDSALTNNIGSASLAVGDQRTPLVFMGNLSHRFNIQKIIFWICNSLTKKCLGIWLYRLAPALWIIWVFNKGNLNAKFRQGVVEKIVSTTI